MNILLTSILLCGFIAATLATSGFLRHNEVLRRRLARIARIGGISPAQADRRGFAALLSQLPPFAKAAERQRLQQARKAYAAELPRMLEIIALGVRSGLGFDQAFALYVRRFDTPLAQICRSRLDIWERGLISREQGLRELSEEVSLPMFKRFVATTLRALEYGAALNNLLLDLATETRKTYRSEQQELVAKAPVKMLLPTGALILPAMLLLVIGPIMLEFTGRME
ncbi:MAG: type II secretion system F family protein [Coriobacteriales bacterium]|jgi:tight adherence protein C|nr:type II secretion system F family protein [Coriobacteriales bacterium]